MKKINITRALSNFGFLLLLPPVAVTSSASAFIVSVVLYAISLSNRLKPSWLDMLILAVSLLAGLSWLLATPLGQQLFVSQISSYFVLLLILRFIDSCKEDFFKFITSIPATAYILLCMAYIIIQEKVGYEYEIGSLEAFLLIRILILKKDRLLLSGVFLVYLLAMHLISTRSTPLVIAILFFISLLPAARGPLKLGYLATILATPALGIIFYGIDIFSELLNLDDNAEIRYEMIKGATYLIGIKELIIGTGFGQPFRDAEYDYFSPHPLLTTDVLTYLVSNHNSLFDVFLRTGLTGYIFFAIFFLKASSFLPHKSVNARYSIIAAVCLFSLFVNAYLDSTKLTLVLSVMLAGIMFLSDSGKVVTQSPVFRPGK